MQKVLCRPPVEQCALAAVEAFADQAEERLDALVQVVAVAGFVAGQAHQFEVAQMFQAVALAVGLGFQRGVAEFRAGLDVEEEKQAVHVAQGFEAQFRGERVVQAVDALLADFGDVADGVVADQFDGFPQGVLEIVGNGEGVLVAVLVQAVVQAHALARQQAADVQQGGGGSQRVGLVAAQDVVQEEAQQAVVRPLAAFDQHDLAGREQQHPARGMVAAEDAVGDDALPGFLEQRVGGRTFAVELVAVGLEDERVFVVVVMGRRRRARVAAACRCAFRRCGGRGCRRRGRPADSGRGRSRSRGRRGVGGTMYVGR